MTVVKLSLPLLLKRAKTIGASLESLQAKFPEGDGTIEIHLSPVEAARINSMEEREKLGVLNNRLFLSTHKMRRQVPSRFAFRSTTKNQGSPRRFRMGFGMGDKNKKVCMARGRLVDSTVNFLRKYQNQPDPRKEKHFEIGAAMRFTLNNDKSVDIPLYNISIDVNTLKKGDHDGTDVPASRINCHTHPSGEYPRQKVCFAWASKDDVLAIREKILDEKENCIVHIVCATEGFYVICLNKELLESSGDIARKIDEADVEKHYKVRLPGEKGDDNDGLPETPEQYISYVRNIPKKHRIYDIEFVKWPKKGHSEVFSFSFPSCAGKCNPDVCEECSDL